MKVLFTGGGTSGSWQIRGIQIGMAMSATLAPRATLEQCQAADVIVVVKRLPAALLENIRASGRPWVWDIVDAYPQPKCSAWGEVESKEWLAQQLEALKPDFVIWPNERMQRDGTGGAVIYHHHRPGAARNPIREHIRTVGYEGQPDFLGEWKPIIEAECRRRGARFVVNPFQLADLDVVIALRGNEWNGYPQRHWKSQVKLANAHATGTPFIGAPEDGYIETACGAEYWASSPEDLGRALDDLKDQSMRRHVSERFLKSAFSIRHAAERYRDVLRCALKS